MDGAALRVFQFTPHIALDLPRDAQPAHATEASA